MTNSDTRPTEQGETRRQIAESIARRGVPYSWLNNEDDYRAALNWFANEISEALRNERERALTDAARQECVFCAGVEGFNPIPVEAALPAETDAGNYVHRNDPPHGLAGVYCKAQRIRALICAIRKDQG